MWKAVVSVNSLSDVLNKLQGHHMDSIHFFHGQDNKNIDNTVDSFWMVLHNLLCNNACPDIVDCTKLKFARKGYKGLYFYLLPNDSSQGSRELLLALSWLISQNIIEEKIDLLVSKLLDSKPSSVNKSSSVNNKPSSVNNKSSSVNNKPTPVNNKSSSVKQQKFETKKREKKLDCLIYEAGQCRIAHRHYLTRCYEREKLLSKVKRLSEEIPPYISLIHAYYIRFITDSLRNNVAFCPVLLNSYFSWKSQEKIYYEWIKTVIDKKRQKDKKLIDNQKTACAADLKLLLKNEITKNIPLSTIKSQRFVYLRGKNYAAILKQCMEKLSKLIRSLGLHVLK